MQTVLTIKKWHAENNDLLEKLIAQSHEIISAKDTVFGVGGRSGVRSKIFLPKGSSPCWLPNLDRLEELERDFNLIEDHLQGEISNLKSKLLRLSKSIDDTRTLIQVQVLFLLLKVVFHSFQVSETSNAINKGNRNTEIIKQLKPQVASMQVDVKNNNGNSYMIELYKLSNFKLLWKSCLRTSIR